MAPTSASCVVIVGAGDVGGRLADLRAAQGNDVLAVRRRAMQERPPLRWLRADVATGEGVSRLPRRPDALVFCAAPDQRDEGAYRALYVDGLRRVLDQLDPVQVVFVSSTAVYGEEAGEWVDEETAPRPPAFNGRLLWQAEQELVSHPRASCLRLSGLYGPGRDALLRRARAGSAGRRHWSNRIHVADAAQALSHVLDLPSPATLYLGNDDRPTLEFELQAWVRAQEGLPPLPEGTGDESGRRISNRRLRASGWMPRYPDFTSGYAPMLATPGV